MYNFNDICRIRGILFGILFLFISSGFFLMLWIVAKERGNFFAVYDIFVENGFVTAVNSVSIWEYVISGGFIIFFSLGLWCMMGGNMSFVETYLNKLGYDIDEVRNDIDYSEKLDKFYIGEKFLVTSASANINVVKLSDIMSICKRTEIEKLSWHFIPIVVSKLYFIDITPVKNKKFEVRCKNKTTADEIMKYLEERKTRDGYSYEMSVKEPESLIKRVAGFARKKLFK